MRLGLSERVVRLLRPRWQRKIAKSPAARHSADGVIWEANVAAFARWPLAAWHWRRWDGANVIVVVLSEELRRGAVPVVLRNLSYGAAGERGMARCGWGVVCVIGAAAIEGIESMQRCERAEPTERLSSRLGRRLAEVGLAFAGRHGVDGGGGAEVPTRNLYGSRRKRWRWRSRRRHH